jgi:DNA-binding MarR family transcriptional regulator
MTKGSNPPAIKTLPRHLLGGMLGFFYPIHYGIAMEVETRMCQNRISRQQAAVIWLIESTVGGNGWMRRRIVEQMLKSWFETSSSQVSMMLKDLSSPPLSFIQQMENPNSAREKLVALTPQGRAFFQSMLNAGIEFLGTRLAHISEEMAQQGISFYSAVTYLPPGDDNIMGGRIPGVRTPPSAPVKSKRTTGK